MYVKRWLTTPELFEEQLCTAEWLRQLATDFDGKPTSSAAVARVLDRWVSVGYAIVKRKPIRFVDLTPEGRELGLAELYRRERRRRSAKRRGIKL